MTITREEFVDRLKSHKLSVQFGTQRVIDDLVKRSNIHDEDKLSDDEFEGFYESIDNLNSVKFGTDEYYQALRHMKPALDLHYARSVHHPQHFENGVNDMNLMDIIEMFIDWKCASSALGDNINFEESLKINKERFKISDQLYSVLMNTAKHLGYLE